MRNEKGSSVLELALLIPLLVVLLMGVTELSRMFSAAMGVSQAARAGAAYGMQHGLASADLKAIENATLLSGREVPGLMATVTRVCLCSNGSEIPCGGEACPGKRGYIRVATEAEFRTSGRYPGIPDRIRLTGQAVLRHE